MNPPFSEFRVPLFIAEIGGNHEGDFEFAKRLVVHASKTGAQAVKFQTYTADKIVSPVEGKERNQHFKKFELPYEQFRALAELANSLGLIFMSSLWDADAIAALDPFIPIHKVGSGDLTNYPLLKQLANTGKPIILSTAMATLSEIEDAVEFISSHNSALIPEHKLAILHCVAMYGEPRDEYANLGALRVLQERFPQLPVGYSDHSTGIYACELALAMGACIIEKHFTDDTERSFRDHRISATEASLGELVVKSKRISTLIGAYEKQPIPAIETPQRIKEFRRAVYLIRDLPKGTVVTEEHLTTLRPLHGIDARKYFDLIGRTLAQNKRAHEALSESDFA